MIPMYVNAWDNLKIISGQIEGASWEPNSALAMEGSLNDWQKTVTTNATDKVYFRLYTTDDNGLQFGPGTSQNQEITLSNSFFAKRGVSNGAFYFTPQAGVNKYTITAKWNSDNNDGFNVTVTPVETPINPNPNPTPDPKEEYFLVGDLSCFQADDTDWTSRTWSDASQAGVNKLLRFINNGDGTYSLTVPASRVKDGNNWKNGSLSNTTTDAASKFVIVPGSSFTGTESTIDGSGLSIADWKTVLRPTDNNNISTSHLNGKLGSGTNSQSTFDLIPNGASYTITFNPTEGTWTATSNQQKRIMYIAVRENGYWRAYQYQTDESSNTDGSNFDGQYNGEFTTDGTGILVLHNWHKDKDHGSYYNRQQLKMYSHFSDSQRDFYPIDWDKSGTKQISAFSHAGTYNTGTDPSRGNVDGSSFGDFDGNYGLNAIVKVVVPVPERGGKVIRTFAYDKDLEIPTNFKAYAAQEFKSTGTSSTAVSGTVYLRELKYIPANEGVVLVGKDVKPGNFEFPLYSGTLVSKKEELWKKDGYTENWNNFLVPCVEAKTIENGVSTVTGGKYNYTARHFALNSYANTKLGKAAGVAADSTEDVIGFYRAKGNVRATYAYLSLPSTDNGFGAMNYDGQLLTDSEDANNAQLAKAMIAFDDEIATETTGITNLNAADSTASSDNSYYNLQGQKVLRPTRGIYIHKGKKIIIK